MRRAIFHKLRSQRGASLLLALLFLLLCSMVTASILMAAVANAGKYRSNQEEHQTYLALSSAITTLCDELNRAEYQGQYSCWMEEKISENTSEGDDSTETTVIKYYYFEQKDGLYRYPGTEREGRFHALLLNSFDALFAKELERVLNSSQFTSIILKTEPVPMNYALTLTPATGTTLDSRNVTLSLTIKESYAIYITAYLDDLPEYKVEAELTPNANAPTISSLSFDAVGSISVKQTAPMKWKLGWITIAGDTTEEEGTGG